jgi:hypothetical protein
MKTIAGKIELYAYTLLAITMAAGHFSAVAMMLA